VILRYLRFRLDVAVMRERFRQRQHSGWDSVGASRCEYVVFDHISGSHSVDETISFSMNVDRVTLSHSISAYSLRSVFHDYYFSRGVGYYLTKNHNLGGLIAYLGRRDRHATASSIFNVWAHHRQRMPGMSAGRGDRKNLMAYIDIRHNVMYNWHSHPAGIEAGDIERSRYHVNLVGNYFKPGPNTSKSSRFVGLTVMGHNRVYLAGNVHDDDAQAGRSTTQRKLLRDHGRLQGGGGRILDTPLPTMPVSALPVPTLAAIADDTVGASLPCRDSVDALVIRDVHEGTGHHPFVDLTRDNSPPVPALPTVRHVYAAEDDPFPVWWKLSQGLAADARIDPLADADGDGYTNIEAYMHGLPLRGNPVNRHKPEHHYNPLARPAGYRWKAAPAASGDRAKGWTNSRRGETIHSRPDGLVVMAGAAAHNAPHGCRNVSTDEGYWSPGDPDQGIEGPDGARGSAGPALVMAFPMPQRLKGIRIAKPHPEAFGAKHDPRHVRVQGLRGWPADWVPLATFENVAPFSAGKLSRDFIIAESHRAYFSAYRIEFAQTHGRPLSIQAAAPLMDDGR